MKIVKTVIAGILVFSMLISQCFLAISADNKNCVLLSAQKKYARPGDEVRIVVSIDSNPGISSLKIMVLYDEILELKDVNFNKQFGTFVSASEPYSNPQTISFISPFGDIIVEGAFVTLTFIVSKNAKQNYCADIRLLCSEEDVFDKDFENKQISVGNGMVIINEQFCQTHTDKNDDLICDYCGITIDINTKCNCICHKNGVLKLIKQLQDEADMLMENAMNTEGDRDRYFFEIEKLYDKIKVLREQLELAKATLNEQPDINEEIKRITEIFESEDFDFTEYDDNIVRRIVDCIKVMKDRSIVIILKGGFEITEKLN